MQFDWTTLGGKSPGALVKARTIAHHALQWPAKAARANLDAVPDDSHSSLTWDSARSALFTHALPAGDAAVRVGLRLSGLALIVMRGTLVLDTYELAGRRDSMVGVWLDSALRALGLKAATAVTLPYTIPSHPVARGSAYSFSGETEAFDELVRWFDAAEDLLAEVRTGYTEGRAGPVQCWPHHFDMATLIGFDRPDAERARSIGIGFSPGDHYYPQPYFYVSPYPQPMAAALPPPPSLGHWHTSGFIGAVAIAETIISREDRGTETAAFVRAAYDAGRVLIGAAAPEQPPVQAPIEATEQAPEQAQAESTEQALEQAQAEPTQRPQQQAPEQAS
jgi:hypothetical protein